VIDEYKPVTGVRFGFHVDGICRTFFNTNVAALTIVSGPLMVIFFRIGWILNIVKFYCQPDA
jgi:hypothetical protein